MAEKADFKDIVHRHYAGKLLLLVTAVLLSGCAASKPRPALPSSEVPASPPAHYVLRADMQLQLTPLSGNSFQASGLLRLPSGDLLTVSDDGPTLYRIDLHTNSARLIPLESCFTPAQLSPFAADKLGHYDCEGIAQDADGRLYICEEANRWILRCDPKSRQVERLTIDWSPVQEFFSSDKNASFEGIAIGDGKLYVANERSSPRILVVDLATLQVVDHFEVRPQTDSFLGILHYSDLSWHAGHLFVLCRHHRVVLQVDPRRHLVFAEFDYQELEDQLGYRKAYPTGIMEGLAVDDDFLWLATDNNGLGRKAASQDLRPTLLRCPRPDRQPH